MWVALRVGIAIGVIIHEMAMRLTTASTNAHRRLATAVGTYRIHLWEIAMIELGTVSVETKGPFTPPKKDPDFITYKM